MFVFVCSSIAGIRGIPGLEYYTGKIGTYKHANGIQRRQEIMARP
jgi:hypothetical protein